MINKTKNTTIDWFLHLLLILSIIENICSNIILQTDNNDNINSNSLPKIITLQTFRDWSSRLGSPNDTTAQSSALVFQESKEVKTTDYSLNQKPLVTSTQNTIDWLKELSNSESNPKPVNITKDEINAHNIAAQVLSRLIHISPLLALASNGVPYRRYNTTPLETKQNNKIVEKLPSIESLNEIDTEFNGQQTKSERKSASGISFPTIPTTTTMDTTTPTEAPIDLPDYSMSQSEEEEDGDTEEQQKNDRNDNNDRPHDHSEEDDSQPPEESDDYEDDDEMESFRYPVRVTFPEADEDQIQEPDHSPPFVMPNIDLNPESLKQKGCRTVVKEVQAIPVENGLQKQNTNPKNVLTRIKRNSDKNSQKFTSIVMTKECHFPGDEGSGSEQTPQIVPTTIMSGSTPDTTYQSPTAPNFEEYDEDFDFNPQLNYPSSDLIDRMEPKSSNDRKSYADNPIFRRDNSEYMPQKDDFDFDDMNSNYFDINDRSGKRNPRMGKIESSSRYSNNKNKPMSNSQSGGHDFDDEEFGTPPRNSRHRIQNSRSQQKRPPVYRNEGNGRHRGGQRGGNRGGNRKKPKKVNRSFAFFRKAEPKDKDPNESDYAVSYGRGNFQSFSDSYDSDKDGPRRQGRKGRQGKRRSNHDYD